MNNHPHLEVITGPMFSGKSTELCRRLKRAEIAGKSSVLVRHTIDLTSLTHDDGTEADSIFSDRINNLNLEKFDVVGIDEAQFFPDSLDDIVKLSQLTTVIAAGLDTTFAFTPFTIVPALMAYAEKVDKLTAVCVVCGGDATRTQRLINGRPAAKDGPTILVGEEDFYEARCSNCWELG